MTEPNQPHEAIADDDWVEALLRQDAGEHGADYIDDAGFTARVMEAIPAPATLPAWRKPLLAVLWGIAGVGIAIGGAGAVSDSFGTVTNAVASTAYDTWHTVAAHRFSLREIGTALLALGAASWAGTFYALRSDR